MIAYDFLMIVLLQICYVKSDSGNLPLCRIFGLNSV